MKPFVLGVGAHKCATTWLKQYITYCDPERTRWNDSKMRKKEWHIWDELFGHRIITDTNPQNTLEDLIQSEANIDITPSYAMLNSNQLAYAKAELEDAGFDVSVIFLMRDPVDKLISASAYFDHKPSELYNDVGYIQKSRYELTCENIKKVFDSEKIYFGIYETMFSDKEMLRLSQFLKIPLKLERRNTVINSTENSKPTIDTDLFNQVRLYYDKTYEYCYENFPETQTLWKNW